MGGGGGNDDGDDGQFVVAVWAALDAVSGWNAVGRWGIGGYVVRSGGVGNEQPRVFRTVVFVFCYAASC
jgi:hypothetical protein